jgi:hypothetical protein
MRSDPLQDYATLLEHGFVFGHPLAEGNDERWVGGLETLARDDGLRTESYLVLDGAGLLTVVRLVRPDGTPYEESIRRDAREERERLRVQIVADWGATLAGARRRRRAPAD